MSLKRNLPAVSGLRETDRHLGDSSICKNGLTDEISFLTPIIGYSLLIIPPTPLPTPPFKTLQSIKQWSLHSWVWRLAQCPLMNQSMPHPCWSLLFVPAGSHAEPNPNTNLTVSLPLGEYKAHKHHQEINLLLGARKASAGNNSQSVSPEQRTLIVI